MTKGTYISTELTPLSTKYVMDIMAKAGVANPLEAGKHHMTLLYAPETVLPYNKRPASWLATVTGVKVLGEGKWQGLVLALKCPQAEAYHQKLLDTHGDIHSYPTFDCHMTVKYRPDMGDLQKVKKAFRYGTRLSFTGIKSELLEP